MELSFELTLVEFKSALKLHFRQKMGRKIHLFIYNVVFPAVTAVVLTVTLYAYITGGLNAIEDFVIPDVTLVTIIVLVFVLRRYRLRSEFRDLFPSGAKDRTTSISISDEEILSSVKGVGETRYLWSGISTFIQNEMVGLFYITNQRFLVLPMRVLSPAQRTELADLIASHVTKREP